MKRSIILCGIPGAGKTYYVDSLADRWRPRALFVPGCFRTVSTDLYWEGPPIIPFNSAKLGDAHAWCFRNYLQALNDSRTELVVVDNTNLTVAEIAPYHLAGAAFGFHVEIHRLLVPHEIAWSRQTHGVKLEDFMQMVDKFNALPKQMPAWWNWSDI